MLADAYALKASKVLRNGYEDRVRSTTADKRFRFEMPHLAAGGLSESWLLMESGRMHWERIFGDMGIRPTEFRDHDGARIYPTFARIAWDASKPLRGFREDDNAEILSLRYKRAGGYSVSAFRLVSGSDFINVRALSIDAKKVENRGNRLKRVASEGPPARLKDEPLILDFARSKESAVLERQSREHERRWLHKYTHAINPFYEVNGVNLLYFAAHPIIANLAERDYALKSKLSRSDLAFTHSTVACEVSFFRNCEVTDGVLCGVEQSTLDDPEWREKAPCESIVRLYRSSDRKLMSIVRTRKESV
jgi:probable biosynthetic protein (TIGR04098 family)